MKEYDFINTQWLIMVFLLISGCYYPLKTIHTPQKFIEEEKKAWQQELKAYAFRHQQTKNCRKAITETVRYKKPDRFYPLCEDFLWMPGCLSYENNALGHFDFTGSSPDSARILVFSLIHGDEFLAGELALHWIERLQSIDSRNTWRILPLTNPDGLKRGIRANSRGVDLNRNFPTEDWEKSALHHWKTRTREDPRRYPGSGPASEKETVCLLQHIEDFQPHFIVSLHTPYEVLDFDGPTSIPAPPYHELPWRPLGNFPGSLGRFMWVDFKTPVLTVELGNKLVDIKHLQDVIGSFALKAKASGEPPSFFQLPAQPIETGH